MRMRGEHGCRMRLMIPPRGLSGVKTTSRSLRGNFQRRRERGDVPTRIAPRKFVTGRKIDAALRIELAQQCLQAALVGDLGIRALDGNAGGR